MPCSVDDQVAKLAALLLAQEQRLATAESCTGGLVAAALTALPGSSVWFERGWVTYSNTAKTAELEVAPELIATHGAVSEPVARAMAEGARRAAGCAYALSITGVAGPDGGSTAKPVGTVCFGWATPGGTHVETQHFTGDRAQVRTQSVAHALGRLIALLQNPSS